MTLARLLVSRRSSLLAFVAPLAFAQAGPAPMPRPEPPPTVAAPSLVVPEYDVFSIKLNKSGNGMIRMMGSPDGFTATNIPFKSIIANAYGLKEDLVSGAPGWVDADRYDVTAKVSGDDVPTFKKLTSDQRNAMLQPLLADRLKLKVHYETRELPIYELVLAKSGFKLHEATPGDTYPNGLKGPDGTAHPGMMMMQPGKITAQAIPIANLINILSRQLQRTIIDKTGLTGKYDITLQWSPEEGQGSLFGVPPPQPPPPGPSSDASTPAASSAPSIFTAIEEQLGLKLNSTKGPVKTLVIDHIEPPTEN
jgi:uncharacterized protein (TIGR03435 family)